jgi:hypothetical protein
MPVRRKAITLTEEFTRGQVFTTTPGGDIFGLTIADTSATGAPTYVGITSDAGAAKLTLAATAEVENVCLFQNDVLPFKLSNLISVEYNVLVAGIDSVTTLVWGIASARNDTPDTTTVNAQFRMEGSVSTSLIVVETDDNTTDNDDKATGVSLTNAYKRCLIDFSYGLADVRFFIDGARVATGTTFNMSAATSTQQVQLNTQIQKASGTGVPSLTIDMIEVVLRVAA